MTETDLSKLAQWARDQRQAVQVVERQMVPPKLGLNSPDGQARLLHDIANVELQAVELGIRTLNEFPSAPAEFRTELSALTQEEIGHFNLCRSGMAKLGFRWGAWPVHALLSASVSPEDTLLERIFIVHCYLEGSGLDSGEVLLRRLSGIKNQDVHAIIAKIVSDEVQHVSFGTRWFRRIANESDLEPKGAMLAMIHDLNRRQKLPARGAEMAVHLRAQAGFSQDELDLISTVQRQY